jgi:inorganic pyrophosphatase/exopolyphosphatase
MNRKNNFQKLKKTNVKYSNIIRRDYKTIHFNEEYASMVEEQQLELKLKLQEYKENFRKTMYFF